MYSELCHSGGPWADRIHSEVPRWLGPPSVQLKCHPERSVTESKDLVNVILDLIGNLHTQNKGIGTYGLHH